eukprot:scaffold80600_cov68-Attheya_sp.AAC.2
MANANDIAIEKSISNVTIRDKSNSELVAELTSGGYIFDHHNYSKLELQGLAQNRDIDIKVSEQTLIEGWAGKRKGYLQTLWETGHLDPSIPIIKYKVKPNKTTDIDENGNIKEEAAKFILPYILGNHPRFQK